MKVSEAIKARRTNKLKAEEPLNIELPADFDKTIEELISLSGWAPFHFPSHESHQNGLDGIEPWRFYYLDRGNVRKLRESFIIRKPIPAPEGILNMLAASNGLVICTWLPDPDPEYSKQGTFKPTHRNMEHIAAAGAACQNFLLGAVEKGINAYWSSGGALRMARVFEFMGIPTEQVLLGALFLFPDMEGNPGKNRALRADSSAWSKRIEI